MNFYKKLLYFLFIYYLVIFKETENSRILGVFPFHSKSHNLMFESLMKGLAKHGHIVDIITHFEIKDPPNNYRIIINLNETNLSKLTNALPINFISTVKHDMPYFFAIWAENVCQLLSQEKMQKFIKNSSINYDLIITEAFTANCYFGLGYVIKAPVITISTMMEFPWTFSPIGNPDSSSFVANIFFQSSIIETFFDRFKNTLMIHYNRNRFYKFTEKSQTKIMRKYLSPNIPNIREVEKNVALMFTNCHYTICQVKPQNPAIISIAGLHVEQNTDVLPFELKKWMDDSANGVIYFTFGSMYLIESLSENILLEFYEAFSKISPIRVLMKIANENMLPPGLPENVRLFSWLPQIPILKHKNTKVFITHGGLLGCQEAIYYSIPFIGFPLTVDQFINVDILVKKKMAIQMNHETMTAKNLIESLNLILLDPSYKNAAIRESRLFRDRPMSAMKTAIFWVEYIIRNGAKSLKSPAEDLYWWQVELLDVYAFLILLFLIILYLFIFLMKKIFLLIYNRKNSSQASKMKNN
ncbi:UDP-glucosyltransferase 2-like [Leptopilina boulardi]|uniref:UDP-glucosyltransferase 2-like n=1 Tax=Leptopilina boulardi TaxID=63433 RepID=UPI0021F650CA|nr:UDP-glucosyltransferase 2-like [Leptopilina boulardi]